MKLAVMQPYFMPYIGYFQMINAVDVFVLYDDVNFIKQGWINRNKILINNKDFMFTIPLQKATSFCLIKDTLINKKFYGDWRVKFERTIDQNYKKAPYFTDVSKLIYEVLGKNHNSIADLAIESIIATSKYLGLKTKFYVSSQQYENKDLDRQNRLIDICKKENASHYINVLGGKELYDKAVFKQNGIELSLITTLPIKYKQFNNEFIPWLSIIDVLMFNSIEEVTIMLDKFELS